MFSIGLHQATAPRSPFLLKAGRDERKTSRGLDLDFSIEEEG
jgi:hypothetical protein